MDRQANQNGDRSPEQQGYSPSSQDSPTTKGRELLDRDLPLDYLQEWTTTLAENASISESAQETFSVVLFRLGNERLALPICVLQEITSPSAIHTLPHRSTNLFLGLVNIRGEILPCVSLTHLLGVETSIDPTYSRVNLRRMIVMGSLDRRWVFPADEVYRIHRFQKSELQDLPIVVTKAAQAYTQGIIDWKTEKVNYLNADLLLETLDRRIL